jgi:hypothetical protein|tara:strand:+ start:197 stop:484 length:288 start_codon:yes stop_codon:yes gene_type:complete
MSNKKFRKKLPPEQEFIKFQEDFCKVLDVFEYRGKKFTDDKAIRLLMMACFMIDVYAKSELNQKDYEFMKDRIIFNMLNDNRVLDTEDDKDRVIH